MTYEIPIRKRTPEEIEESLIKVIAENVILKNQLKGALFLAKEEINELVSICDDKIMALHTNEARILRIEMIITKLHKLSEAGP